MRIAETNHLSSALVETGKFRPEVCRITGIGRHLSQTTRNFTKSLCPTRRRVSHHGDVGSLVTEIFGKRDSSIDGGFTGSDRHIRGVCNERRALHNRFLTATDFHCELREL